MNIPARKITSSAPVGIFDSGVGGLTVFKEIRVALPSEDIIYLGDTARVPYGTKSVDVVKKYSKQNVEFLLSEGVKTIIVACNTASAASITYLNEIFQDILIIGVIDPVVEHIRNNLSIKRVGVIGTATTIESNAYQNALRKYI
ncbi:MAG TPA: aspartate/glutamate racemase family protein, partial [bacterium]|nr:aspartate/glutamate racemase family protein [bacterium]